jgi:hypothetical protein
MTPAQHPAPQRGAITLLVAIGLVVLASGVSFYTARSVLVDQLASHNHAHASQARLAADAALGSAQAVIGTAAAAADAPTQLNALFANRGRCPAGVSGAQWECAALSLPAHPAMPQAELSAIAVRDVVLSPHAVTLHASARLSAQHSQATVRESLFIPALAPAPALAAPAALVLNGCLSEALGALLRVCPLTRTGQVCSGTPLAPAVLTHFAAGTPGQASTALPTNNACLALSPGSLPIGGGLVATAGPTTPTTSFSANMAIHAASSALSSRPCNRAAWRSVLGDTTDAQLQAWSTAQERLGLNAHSTPPRTVYWIDSPGDWAHSVGTADQPALLVFSAQACAQRCPRIGTHVRIVGSVVFDAGCNDDKMRGWQGGTIEGQLVVESGLPDWVAGQVLAHPQARQAYRLHWPEGIDAAQVQRVHGSWSEGTP